MESNITEKANCIEMPVASYPFLRSRLMLNLLNLASRQNIRITTYSATKYSIFIDNNARYIGVCAEKIKCFVIRIFCSLAFAFFSGVPWIINFLPR
jgi:hypothetical protein